MTVYFYGVFEFQGGMENYAKTLIQGVIEKDPSIHFVIIKDRPHIAYEDLFLSIGCEIVEIPNQNKHPLGYYKALKELFLKAKANGNFVQLNAMSYRNFLLFKAVKKSKVKTLVVAHGAGIAGTPLRFLHRLFRPFYKNVGKPIAISAQAAEFQYGKSGNAQIIQNAIDPKPYQFDETKRNEVRKNLRLSSTTMLLGQVGRVCPIKNQVFSILVLQRLLEKGTDVHLVFVGAIQDDAPKQLAKTLHLENHVTFIGEGSPANYYSAFDVALLPSLSEGAGLVVQEALANGLPMLISDNVPIFPAGKNQLAHYLPLKEGKWANAIRECRRSSNCSDKLKDSFDLFIDNYLALYRG